LRPKVRQLPPPSIITGIFIATLLTGTQIFGATIGGGVLKNGEVVNFQNLNECPELKSILFGMNGIRCQKEER
jgi:hypothetical protein